MKTGFTCSSFDLLHAGHIMMLKESRMHCDKLIVGLNISPIKNGRPPIQSVVQRYTQLAAIGFVDQIIPYSSENELIELLSLYSIDIRFIGDDYKDKKFTGDHLPIEIFYNQRSHDISTSGLKQQIRDQSSSLHGTLVKDDDTYTIVDNTDLNDLTVSTTILHPSKHTKGHAHEGIEEVYYFISGVGHIMVCDEYADVSAGSVVTIPDGGFHQVFNDSTEEDLYFICVFNDRRNH